MSRNYPIIPQLFKMIFSGNFGCDTLVWDDANYRLFCAEAIVEDLIYQGMGFDQIICLIEALFANWGEKVFEDFTNFTYIPWDDDIESEEMLRAILTKMLKTAQQKRLPSVE